MRIVSVLIVALWSSWATAQERCAALPEVLEAALATSPDLGQALAEREIARAQVWAARSQARPQVNFFGQAGIGDRQPLDQSRDDQVGFQATLELYSFGQRSAQVEQAREVLRAAQAGELQAQLDVAEQAILLYFELLRTEELVALTAAQADGYAQEAETIEERLARGLVTRSDARQIEARYASALADREEAEADRDNMSIQLSVFTGLEVRCGKEGSARAMGDALFGALGDLTVPDAMVLAETSAMSLRRAQADVRSAQAGLRAANRAGRPTLSANAFVLGNYNDSEFDIPDRWTRDDRVGFSLRQEIFAGGRLRADRAESRGRLRTAVALLEAERRVLENDVRQSVLGVNRQSMVSARRQQAAEAALDRLEATKLELERGTKTITDFALANEDYYTAAIQDAQASYNRDQELVRLAAVTGLLLDVEMPRPTVD